MGWSLLLCLFSTIYMVPYPHNVIQFVHLKLLFIRDIYTHRYTIYRWTFIPLKLGFWTQFPCGWCLSNEGFPIPPKNSPPYQLSILLLNSILTLTRDRVRFYRVRTQSYNTTLLSIFPSTSQSIKIPGWYLCFGLIVYKSEVSTISSFARAAHRTHIFTYQITSLL